MIESQQEDTTSDEPYICAFGGHDNSGCIDLAVRKTYGHWWCAHHEGRLDYEKRERNQLR